jgi:hypothetical protein
MSLARRREDTESFIEKTSARSQLYLLYLEETHEVLLEMKKDDK